MASDADNVHKMVSPDHEPQLSDQKSSALTHFKDISGISEDDIAKNILESNNWDLEKAVYYFMEYNDPPVQITRRRNLEMSPIGFPPPDRTVLFVSPSNIPWYRKFISTLFSSVRWTFSVVMSVFHFLISLVWSDLRRPVTDPAGDVRNFIDYFKKKYVAALNEDQVDLDSVPPPRMPPFFNGTYADALKEAKRSLRFLIIYLHVGSHENTDVFCRDTLLNSAFLDFLTENSENVLFWGCDINSPEGYRVSETFRERTYPFIGVVGLSNNPSYLSTSFGSPTRMALLGRIEGLTRATELITRINLIMDNHQAVIVAERAERAERELTSRLRREQDEAFQASLEVDRARARERAAAAEAKERLAREAAEALKREALLGRAVVRRQRRWAASLPQEPSGGSDTVRHSIKLPNGTRAQRVFPITDSIKHLYYFIISQEHAPRRFVVESNYPKSIIECRPGDESDIEEYIPKDENADDNEPMPPREIENWKPSSPSDPPSFKDAKLAQPQMLFVLDLDS
ncbi:unnamed protein product [Hymenolepis diminuta]|uniref:UBX domain-containing protein n=1 Tax=Hymenolepis diminuta TaxID=6216 RepID=A0A564ZBN4_HYMDI|nr:unnamed protein product [Hymenolepis diminuta]